VNVTPVANCEMQALGETFDPGEFYQHPAQGRTVMGDRAWYGRFQVTARF
jgi:hypothetical protein